MDQNAREVFLATLQADSRGVVYVDEETGEVVIDGRFDEDVFGVALSAPMRIKREQSDDEMAPPAS